MPRPESLPNLLRRRRAELRWSQTELCRESGVPQSTIAGLESGARRRPIPSVLLALAVALEVDPGEILRAAACGREIKNPSPAGD